MYVHAPLSFSIGKGDKELDPRLYDFMSFLGLVEQDAKGADWNFGRKIGEKVERLYLYGKVMSKSDDHEDIKRVIYDLQRKVGVNWTGKTLVDRLWQHTMLDTSFNRKLARLSEKKKPEPIKEKPKKDLRSEVAGQEPIASSTPLDPEDSVNRTEFKNEQKIKERPRGELKSEPIEI